MSKCFGIKYFFLYSNFNLKKLEYFFKIPNAILSYKTIFGIRKKMPKLPARGAVVPGEETHILN